jgi:ESCO1/2 acetyl-transferase/zinc-finger of acetyl-transferase ESCO
MTQLHLANLGLSTRTTLHCKTCQMDYNKIDPNDQKLHKTHHNSILNGPQFPKPTTITRPLPHSAIPNKGDLVIISRSSSKDLQKRGLHLLSIIDTALGAPANLNRQNFFPKDGKIYTILHSGRIISLVAAERIEFAFRRIPVDDTIGAGIETSGVKEKALIGISRMWTCISERGKGWCTALLDECAAGFVWGVDCRSTVKIIGKGRDNIRGMRGFVAFSTPSESGMGLARKWTGKDDFLVYDD